MRMAEDGILSGVPTVEAWRTLPYTYVTGIYMVKSGKTDAWCAATACTVTIIDGASGGGGSGGGGSGALGETQPERMRRMANSE